MTSLPERQQYVEWVKEAVSAGARKTQACHVARLSIRILPCWNPYNEVAEDRRPTISRPESQNKLTELGGKENFGNMQPKGIYPFTTKPNRPNTRRSKCVFNI